MSYTIIYLDPPWKYNSRANHKTRFRGGADGHYPLMTMPAIAALPVPQLAAKNAALLTGCFIRCSLASATTPKATPRCA
jgi:N6-adenosine-specific RNA methylase IME4